MPENRKLKAVFFGTPDFSVASLETLHKHDSVELIAVVTMPDRPAGRGKKLQPPPVAEYAKDNNIKLIQTSNVNKSPEFAALCEEVKFDFFLVIAFAQFLGSKVLGAPTLGCFNIHTSLLPKYRGAAPIQYALLNGDKDTGVSIQKMVKEMDAGDIVYEAHCAIENDDRSDTLFEKLRTLSAHTLKDFIDDLVEGKLIARPQVGEPSFAPTIKKEDGYVEFEKLDVEQLTNRYRAFYPWPGLYFFINGKRIKIHSIEKSDRPARPGEINTSMNTLDIGCRDGSIHLTKIQPEGKKVISDTDFLNGTGKGETLELRGP